MSKSKLVVPDIGNQKETRASSVIDTKMYYEYI